MILHIHTDLILNRAIHSAFLITKKKSQIRSRKLIPTIFQTKALILIISISIMDFDIIMQITTPIPKMDFCFKEISINVA